MSIPYLVGIATGPYGDYTFNPSMPGIGSGLAYTPLKGTYWVGGNNIAGLNVEMLVGTFPTTGALLPSWVPLYPANQGGFFWTDGTLIRLRNSSGGTIYPFIIQMKP